MEPTVSMSKSKVVRSWSHDRSSSLSHASAIRETELGVASHSVSSGSKKYNQPHVTLAMKSLLFLIAALVFTASPAAIALTVEQDVTPEYVRSHTNEFSVKAAKDKNGLIAFTVVFTLSEPRYVVAHLVLR